MPNLDTVRDGALLFFFLLCSPFASAQTNLTASPGDARLPAKVTAALAAAWDHHPTREVARRSLDAAEARAAVASRPIYNPEVELGAERADVDTIEGGASLTIDIGGKRRARAGVGSAELDVARAKYAISRRDFERQWLAAQFAIGTAAEREAIGRRQLRLIERFAELAERQLHVGDISTLERDLALLAREEARAQSATLMGQTAQARAAVRLAAGDLAHVNVDLTALSLPPPVGADESPPPALPEAVLATREVTAAQARTISAQRERRADPTISLRGGRVDTGTNDESLIGVSVSIPFFVRNSFRAEVQAAQADAASAEAQATMVELETRSRATEATEVYRLLLEAWQQWENSGAGETEKRAELLERLWKAGELSTSDYLVQVKQALDTTLAATELRAQLLRAALDYLTATGRLDDWTGMPPVSGDSIP